MKRHNKLLRNYKLSKGGPAFTLPGNGPGGIDLTQENALKQKGINLPSFSAMTKPFSETAQTGIGTGTTILGGINDAINPIDKFGTRSGGSAIASGVMSGAAAGAALGPLGMAAGAVIGGATSFIGNKKAQRLKQDYLTESSQDAIQERDDEVQRRLALNPNLQYGNNEASMYNKKYGGTLKGKPSGKFSLGRSLRVSMAPDLLPDIAISPGKIARMPRGGLIPDPVYTAKDTIKTPKGNIVTTAQLKESAKNGLPFNSLQDMANWIDGWAHPNKSATSVTVPTKKVVLPDYGKEYASRFRKHYGKGGLLRTMAYGGSITTTSSSTALVKGPKHEQGGVKLPHLGVEVEGGESMAGDFVFSEQLGFAKIHQQLGKAMGRNEKRPDTPLNRNTMVAMKRKEGFLKIYQEMMKKEQGIPNEIDNTIQGVKQAQGSQNMVMRFGGKLPKMQDGGPIKRKVNGIWKTITAEESAKLDAQRQAEWDKTRNRTGGTDLNQLNTEAWNGSLAKRGLDAFKTIYPWLGSTPKKTITPVIPKSTLTPKTNIVVTKPVKLIPKKTIAKTVQPITLPTVTPKPITSASTWKPSDIFKPWVPPTQLPEVTITAPKQSIAANLEAAANADTGVTPDKTKLNIGKTISDLAPFASNIANTFRKLPAPPIPTMDPTLTPDLINLDANRAEAVRQRRGADKVAAQSLNGNNTVAAVKAANITQQVRSMNEINQQEANINTGIKNQFLQTNAEIKKGNSLKRDYYAQQQVERQLKQQELSSENLANVGNKQQAIKRDQKMMELEDDKMLLTIAQDDTGASIRVGDAILKRRLSPVAYKEMKALGAKLEQANAEDRALLRKQIAAILADDKLSTTTTLADAKKKAADLTAEKVKAQIDKLNIKKP